MICLVFWSVTCITSTQTIGMQSINTQLGKTTSSKRAMILKFDLVGHLSGLVSQLVSQCLSITRYIYSLIQNWSRTY